MVAMRASHAVARAALDASAVASSHVPEHRAGAHHLRVIARHETSGASLPGRRFPQCRPPSLRVGNACTDALSEAVGFVR